MTQSNIAGAINAAHAGVEAAKREGARYATECGRLLIQAKETVPHGGWDAWLRLNTTVSPRTAQLYMRIARHVERDPAKAQRVAGLSVREAAAEATGPKRSTAARKLLSPEGEMWLTELRTLWDEAPEKPQWKEDFAREIFRRGHITREQRDTMIRSVWAQHRARLTEAEQDAAGKRAADMIAARIPLDKLKEILPALQNVSPIDMAIMLGDIQEERRLKQDRRGASQ